MGEESVREKLIKKISYLKKQIYVVNFLIDECNLVIENTKSYNNRKEFRFKKNMYTNRYYGFECDIMKIKLVLKMLSENNVKKCIDSINTCDRTLIINYNVKYIKLKNVNTAIYLPVKYDYEEQTYMLNLEVNDISFICIDHKIPIGLIKFNSDEEFMVAINKLYNYDFSPYDKDYYKKIGKRQYRDVYEWHDKSELPYIDVNINSKIHTIYDDTCDHIKRMKENSIEEYLETERYVKLMEKLLTIYISEYIKLEYIDIYNVKVLVKDIEYIIPINQKLEHFYEYDDNNQCIPSIYVEEDEREQDQCNSDEDSLH